MTEFAKMKISFALALLGTLFALHPFVDRFAERGFLYLGYDLKILYAYSLIAGLLSLCVYCYAVAMTTERVHSRLEKLGNYSYAMAVMTLPIYGGLYLASLLAWQFRYSHIAWAAPAMAIGFGGGGFILSQWVAWRLRGRLGEQDRVAKIEHLARQERQALSQARDLFANEHYDLSVVEAWRAIEARLGQVLLSRRIVARSNRPHALFDLAIRKGIIHEPVLGMLEELKRHWNIAVSIDPLTRSSASEALSAARHILATVPVGDPAEQGRVSPSRSEGHGIRDPR
jgi:HEPN domain-containing protein